MEPVEVTAYVLHSVVSGLWVGSVLFVAGAVLPAVRGGGVEPEPLQRLGGRLVWISRLSALVLLLTGGHMAASRYTGETLTGTTGGYLVLAMVVLWLVLIATVEMGTARLRGGTGRDKVREPARNARPFYLAASAAAVGLLVVAGLLSANNAGFL